MSPSDSRAIPSASRGSISSDGLRAPLRQDQADAGAFLRKRAAARDEERKQEQERRRAGKGMRSFHVVRRPFPKDAKTLSKKQNNG